MYYLSQFSKLHSGHTAVPRFVKANFFNSRKPQSEISFEGASASQL